jgi:hypothetical protein
MIICEHIFEKQEVESNHSQIQKLLSTTLKTDSTFIKVVQGDFKRSIKWKM